MTTKGKGLSKLKGAFGRGKQRVLERFGKAQETTDVAFETDYKRFGSFKKVIKSTLKHIEDYQKALQSMTESETALMDGMVQVFETSSPMHGCFNRWATWVGQMEQYRQQLEDSMITDMSEPITEYCKQFKEVRKRAQERKRRLLDMDRYRRDYELAEQKGKDSETVASKQAKYFAMKHAYDVMNDELRKDIPILIDDRSLFYAPLFAIHAWNTKEYYRNCSQCLAGIPDMCARVDTSSAHTHFQVITPEESSAHTMEINLSATVSAEDDPFAQAEPAYEEPQGYDQGYAQGAYADGYGASGGDPYGGGGGGGGGGYGAGPAAAGGAAYPGLQPPPPRGPPGPGPRGPPGPGPGPRGGGMRKSPVGMRKSPKKGGGFKRGGFKKGGFKKGGFKKGPGRRPLPAASAKPKFRCNWAFQGQDDSELTVNEGDMVFVHEQNGEWWMCELRGRRGLLPANYLAPA